MSDSHQTPAVLAPDSVSFNAAGEAVSAEDAYRVYRLTGFRSIRQTADLLGLPRGTVLSWSQRYSWTQRSRDTDLEVVEGAVEGMMMAVVGQTLKSIQALAQVRDDEETPAMAKVEASKTLLREYGNIVQHFGGALGAGQKELEEQSDQELEELVQTPEGVQVLLERQRKRTGKV